jgi:NAD(P)-dependent dehydrogenase (short-subunit alcohol dehydrogenase family)
MSESQKLACKVAIITDVARGIGRATAILFQQPGAIVTALSQPIFEDPEFRAYREKRHRSGGSDNRRTWLPPRL